MALVSTVTIFRPKYDLIRSFTFFAVVEKGQTPPSEHTMTEYSEQIVEELVEVTKHFAGDDQPPEDIAVALFECFEAMQKFNFDGMHALIETPEQLLHHDKFFFTNSLY